MPHFLLALDLSNRTSERLGEEDSIGSWGVILDLVNKERHDTEFLSDIYLVLCIGQQPNCKNQTSMFYNI